MICTGAKKDLPDDVSVFKYRRYVERWRGNYLLKNLEMASKRMISLKVI